MSDYTLWNYALQCDTIGVRMQRGNSRTDPESAFGKALRQIRLERSLSQEQLGLDSGYHRTYISLLERGRMNPSLRTILSLAAVLNVPAAELVRRAEAHLGGSWKRPERS